MSELRKLETVGDPEYDALVNQYNAELSFGQPIEWHEEWERVFENFEFLDEIDGR